jgi:hypothetical protein
MEALMSTSTNSVGPVATLKAPRLNKALITFSRAVYDALVENPSFPSPNPSMTVFAADIDAFDDAETKAASKAKGAAAFRNAKKKKVKEHLFHLRDYVQSVAESSPNPATATALIESAFMNVKKASTRQTPEISAKNADVSGKVLLAAKAVAPAATYSWEYSADQATWIPVPDTMRARTEVSGLESARVYYFRFRALTRTGLRDYSQVVSLLVH